MIKICFCHFLLVMKVLLTLNKSMKGGGEEGKNELARTLTDKTHLAMAIRLLFLLKKKYLAGKSSLVTEGIRQERMSNNYLVAQGMTLKQTNANCLKII